MMKNNFFIAGLITFAVFASGMLVQWNFDQLRTDDILQTVNDLSITTNSVLTERELIDIFQDDQCIAYKERISKIADDVGRLGSRLEKYQDRGVFSRNKMEQLRQEYYILEIFYWTKLLQIKQVCTDHDFVTLLYFYRADEYCPDCNDQAVILTEIKRVYGDKVQIFSLDADTAYTETTVQFLVTKYNVTGTPIIIVDKSLRLQGLVSKEKLEQIVQENMGKTVK
jgi:thiol-disulfide isomerase/thioredoxin